MMGPDYTHWHGTYEVAKHFYTKMLPELEQLARDGMQSDDPQKKAAGEALAKKIEEVLNNTDHRWYLNKTPPEEKAERKAEQELEKADKDREKAERKAEKEKDKAERKAEDQKDDDDD